MHRPRKTLWAVLSAFLALSMSTAPAAAQDEQKLVVLTFTTEEDSRTAKKLGTQARKAVIQASADWFAVIDDGDVTQAEESVGEMDDAEERAARIGGATGAQAILEGIIKGSGREFTIELSVRSPRDGQALESKDIVIPRRRIDRKVKEELGTEVPKLVLAFFSSEKARIKQEQEDKERKEREAKEKAEKEAKEKAEKEAKEKAEKERLEAERKAKEEAERKAKQKMKLRGSVDVGLALTKRSLNLTVENDAFVPYTYDGAMTSAAAIAGEVYPLGLTGVEALGGLGLAFRFDRTLALKTDFGDEQLATAQTRWGVGLRYRFALGEEPATSPAVIAALGFNGLSHTIDFGEAVAVIPDVSYSYLDIGVGFHMPFTEQLSLTAVGRYLQVLSSGAISDPENYGDTSVLGLDFDLGISFLVLPILEISAGFQFTRMGLSFGDDGTLTGGGLVNGGSDTYLGGYLMTGYSF